MAEIRQPKESLDPYVKRFHKKALDCCNPVAKDVLVDICLHGMVEDHQIYLENLSFSSFSRLIEATRQTKFVNKALKLSLMIRFVLKKRCMIATMEKSRDPRAPVQRRCCTTKEKLGVCYRSTFSLWSKKKDASHLEKSIKGNVILFPQVKFFPFGADLIQNIVFSQGERTIARVVSHLQKDF